MAFSLEKKIEQLDKYAYVISYDLRAPLNNCEGLIHLFEDEYKGKSLDEKGLNIRNVENFC